MADASPQEPEPDLEYLTLDPNGGELRGMRKVVRELFDGTVIPDRHTDRKFRLKQAPGKYKSVLIAKCVCDRDHVLVDIPMQDENGEREPLRICLVCDGGMELLGLHP